MNRYTYKAIDLETGKWVCGSLIIDSENNRHILVDNGDSKVSIPVNNDTVCQHIERIDSNKVDLFEGDIIMDENRNIFCIVWREKVLQFRLAYLHDTVNKEETLPINAIDLDQYTILGNYHNKFEWLGTQIVIKEFITTYETLKGNIQGDELAMILFVKLFK